MGGIEVVVIGGTADVVITGADDAGGGGGDVGGVEISGEVDGPSFLQETAAVRRHTVNIALIHHEFPLQNYTYNGGMTPKAA